jgi:hypothetical protein
MKGIFWNSRGLSVLAKTRFLRETSMEHNIAFIALLEIGKKDFLHDTLNYFSGGRHWTAPHGRSGGILLGVNLDVGCIDDGDFFCEIQFEG